MPTAWYHKNEVNRDKQRAWSRARKKKVAKWWKEYKQTLCCSSCGEDHPACLDFHHRDPKQKEISLAHAARAGWAQKRILAEVTKCVVLCTNCHRKVHYGPLA